jgi:hypothetical protein
MFSTNLSRPTCSKNTYVHLENLGFRKNTFQNVTQFSQLTMWGMILILTQMGFYSRDTCVFQLTCICLFEQTQSFPMGKQCATCCSFEPRWFSLETLYVYPLISRGLFGKTELIRTLKNLEEFLEVFIPTIDSILKGKQCARCSCL